MMRMVVVISDFMKCRVVMVSMVKFWLIVCMFLENILINWLNDLLLKNLRVVFRIDLRRLLWMCIEVVSELMDNMYSFMKLIVK